MIQGDADLNFGKEQLDEPFIGITKNQRKQVANQRCLSSKVGESLNFSKSSKNKENVNHQLKSNKLERIKKLENQIFSQMLPSSSTTNFDRTLDQAKSSK